MNFLSIEVAHILTRLVCFFLAIHQKLEADGTEKVEGSMTQKLENVLNSEFAPLPRLAGAFITSCSAGLRGFQGNVPSCALASLLNKDLRSLQGCGKREGNPFAFYRTLKVCSSGTETAARVPTKWTPEFQLSDVQCPVQSLSPCPAAAQLCLLIYVLHFPTRIHSGTFCKSYRPHRPHVWCFLHFPFCSFSDLPNYLP